ncbi:Ankyrin repeat, partial [Globisporangium splendens]
MILNQMNRVAQCAVSACDDDGRAREPGAAMLVLVDPTLLRCITECSTGWPWLVQRFHEQTVPAYAAGRTWRDRSYIKPSIVGLLPHLAIAENDLRVLEMLYAMHKFAYYREHPKLNFTRVMQCAAFYGRVEVLQWLHERLPRHPEWDLGTNMMKDAIRLRDLQLMDWIHAYFPHMTRKINANLQAKSGSLEVIKWCHEHQLKFTKLAMAQAARFGHLEITRFLHEHRTEGCDNYAMDNAARLGNLEIVKFLHENRPDSASANAMDCAAEKRHFDVVQYLHKNNPAQQCTTVVMDHAAAAGRLDIVRMLHEERQEGCTTNAIDEAAWGGHLDVIQFLHEHRTEGCTPQAMEWAAFHGHLEVVRFLHENRSEPVTAKAMDNAAGQGYLHIVQFLHENRSEGCTKRALHGAFIGGHDKVVKYFCVNRSELCYDDLLNDAAVHGSDAVLRVVLEHSTVGCLFEARERAATKDAGRVDLLAEYINEDAESCSRAQHVDPARRPCQRGQRRRF